MKEKILSKFQISHCKQKLFKFGCSFCIIVLLQLCCSRKSNFEQGVEYMKKGEYVKAVKSLKSALAEDSLNSEIHYNLCLAHAFMDSSHQSFHHYLKLTQLGSNLKDDTGVKEMMANFLNLEPYPSSIIPMAMRHQFKGSFSPDGEMIAVAAAKQDRADIYLIRLDGSIIKKLIKGGMNTDPDFSPSGDHLVFVSDRDGDDELYLYDMKAKTTEKLTDNTVVDFSPSFSPDGEEIVFVSHMDGGWEIYKINLGQKRISRLTKNNYWDGFPKFSTDGKWITFSSRRGDSEDIYIMKSNGGSEKLLYSSPTIDNDPILFDDKLYFKSRQSGDWEIYQMDLKNKSLLRLTINSFQDWNPRISRDGSKMLVTRMVKKRWRLYFINLSAPISAEFIASKIKKIQ